MSEPIKKEWVEMKIEENRTSTVYDENLIIM